MELGLVKPHREPETETTAWEEDEYYVELRRQILLLTADEDEDEDAGGYCLGFNGLAERNRNSTGRQFYEDISSFKKIHSGKLPTAQVDLPRNVNGTGVFIPTAYAPRRRGRPGRFNQRRGKNKQVARIIRDPSFRR